MDKVEKKNHWENIYQTKESNDVSWYQPVPNTSLEIMNQMNISLTAKIIDVGGGDGLLVDNMLALGYQNVTVLDISEVALEKAKHRLGDKASKVKWICSDIIDFKPTVKYDFWHDRAAFHFLTEERDIIDYLQCAVQSINSKGIIVLGTFSTLGPTKCSGINIRQYSEESMNELLEINFEKIKCFTLDHWTPFNTKQNFLFCVYRKK